MAKSMIAYSINYLLHHCDKISDKSKFGSQFRKGTVCGVGKASWQKHEVAEGTPSAISQEAERGMPLFSWVSPFHSGRERQPRERCCSQ